MLKIVFYYDIPLTTAFLIFRNLVSASQDGKLIVWDSYTTNKVNYYTHMIVYTQQKND